MSLDAAALAAGRAAVDPRARDLARMRGLATGLLGLMAAIYAATLFAPPQGPWLGYLRAFAEAGMVGACADWFAVTALFRRPLGLPIPHTAIIPRNKARIGEALGRFIADNFLTAEVLDARLRQLEVARWGGAWLREPRNARRLALRLAAMIPPLLRALPKDTLREAAAAAAQAAVRRTPAAPAASRLLAAVWSEGRAQALIAWAVAGIQAYLSQNAEIIQDKVEAQSYRWMPRFVDRAIATKITAGLQALLQDLLDPDHPWRLQLRAAVEGFIQRLAEDPELLARGEALKARLLADPGLAAQAERVWSDLERGLGETGGRDLAPRLEQLLVGLGHWLDADEAAQARLNTWARALAGQVIAPRRHDIGDFVAQVVSAWDTKSVVDKLELQVGRDLQYIRINGTLVGGLVGLLLHGLSGCVVS